MQLKQSSVFAVATIFIPLLVATFATAQTPLGKRPPGNIGAPRPAGGARPDGARGPQAVWIPEEAKRIRIVLFSGFVNRPPECLQEFCRKHGMALASPDQDFASVAKLGDHPEIESAWAVYSGISAGGSLAVQKALARPERTLAVIAIHGAMLAQGNDDFNRLRQGNIPGDIKTFDVRPLLNTPMLLTYDNRDGFVCPVHMEGFVRFGRRQGAPWAFAAYDAGNHTDVEVALQKIILPWLDAIIRRRILESSATKTTAQSLEESSGWLGDVRAKSIAPSANFKGDKTAANWFPDENTARDWAAFAIVPPYSIPDQAERQPSGIIQDLTLLDPRNNDLRSGINWRICGPIREADPVCNNIRYFVVGPVPPSIAGCDWIRSMQPGKDVLPYSADPILTFKMGAAGDVFIAHADPVQPKPSWLSEWTPTGEKLRVSAGDFQKAMEMTLFKKRFAAGAVVMLGANSTQQRGGALMYATFVKPGR